MALGRGESGILASGSRIDEILPLRRDDLDLDNGRAILFEPSGKLDLVAAAPSILYTGLLSSALTFTILAIAMRHTPPAEASILVSTESVFAAIGAAIFLGERLPPIGILGASMMFGATVLIQLAPLFERRVKQ